MIGLSVFSVQRLFCFAAMCFISLIFIAFLNSLPSMPLHFVTKATAACAPVQDVFK